MFYSEVMANNIASNFYLGKMAPKGAFTVFFELYIMRFYQQSKSSKSMF